jgi:hypothetical protein
MNLNEAQKKFEKLTIAVHKCQDCKITTKNYIELNPADYDDCFIKMCNAHVITRDFLLNSVDLICPECGYPEWKRIKTKDGKFQTILFECMFSAYIEADKTNYEIQSILYEFQASGNLKKWVEKPLF